MTSRPLLIAASIVAALALAGCTTPNDDSTPTATVTNPAVTASPTETSDAATTPEPDSATYATVEDLKTALVAAGFACDDWDASAGTCGDDYVLQVFPSAAERDVAVNAEQGKTKPTPQAIGANWIVTAAKKSDITDMGAIVAKLGGFIAPTGS